MKTKHLLLSAFLVGASLYSFHSHKFKNDEFNKHSRHPASQEKNEALSKDQDKAQVDCKNESKGEKLADDVKKLIEDKEDVINKVDGDKTEDNKKEEKISQKSEIDHSQLMSLLSQMTTLMSQQMQMQLQMMSMMFGQLNQPTTLPDVNEHKSHLNFNDQLSLQSYGIGLSAPTHQSPYYNWPELRRQPAQISSDFGFGFGQAVRPQIQGYDFNQFHGQPLHALPEMQRISL